MAYIQEILLAFAIGFFCGWLWRHKKVKEEYIRMYYQKGVKPPTQSLIEIILKLIVILLIGLAIWYTSGMG